VRALSTELSPWLASLVLAAAWAVLGVLLALFVRARARRIRAWDAAEAERARAEAEQAVRETLEQLSPALSKEIALAAVPAAGDMAGGVVDAGEELIESADEIVETLTENVPGGSVVNQMWDVVLVPGRLGIRVATTVLRRGDSVS
jgi:flagellar biosynthesis/type III secretory pathway M-ring protein FliF/YscJ